MLSRDFVLSLLQASITGAGLVLAVYALIIPLSRKFLGYRAEAIYDELQQLKEKIRKTDTRISQEELSELKKMLESIEERRGFPSYLSWLAGATFSLFILSALMGMWWISDFYKPIMDAWLSFVFGCSTLLFAVIGILSIKDISQTMKIRQPNVSLTELYNLYPSMFDEGTIIKGMYS